MADNNLVMEERTESMVSVANQRDSCLRTAHFLTPSVTSIDTPVRAPKAYSPTDALKYNDFPFQVKFDKLKYPTKEWENWVDHMKSLHHMTWKRAGIFDAIMSSTSIVRRNRSLIYAFAEKWCPDTNSFVFPWGEATVTLEDLMVLGGYSVLGDSVLINPEETEIKETVEQLKMECSLISHTKAKKAGQNSWMKKFMDSGSEIEHEAFLAYWLSRFVFPMDSIGRKVLPVAVHLSRETKIGLAPAVLAGIYKNLSLLKTKITAAREIGNRGEGENVQGITVSAPLALVQVWIWERFLSLGPNPNSIGPGQPRIARWHNLSKADIQDFSLRIDSAVENFEWRPYTTAIDSSIHRKIYVDNEYWVSVESELDEDLEGLVRCLRTSELVGIEADCIEQYLPHRVAMQFGMDQDLPGCVARVNASPQIAWSNYFRPIRDKTVYVPPRVFEPGVTTRYLTWWKDINCGLINGTVEDGIDGKNGSDDSKVEAILDVDLVPSSSNWPRADSHGKCSLKNPEVISTESSSGEDIPPPPGFPPRRKRRKAEDSRDSGISKPLKYGRNTSSAPQPSSSKLTETKFGVHENDGVKSSKAILVESSSSGKGVAQLSLRESCGDREFKDDNDQVRIHSSSAEKNGNIFQDVTLFPRPAESNGKNILEKQGEELQKDVGLRLEERVTVVEKLCDLLKTGKLSCNSIKKLNK